MAKSLKHPEKTELKSGRYISKISAAGALFPKSESKFHKSKNAGKFSHEKSIVISDIKMSIPHQGSHSQITTVIVEDTHTPEWQMTAVEKMNLVREGVSKKKLESLKSKTNLDYDKLSTILSTNRATLINKKGSEHFSTVLSERIVSIADLYSYGYEVFEDETKFNEWIFRSNKALGGKQPFELLDNHFGREEIKNVIGRIDYGVYS